MKVAIIIPARYGSSRYEGKPLIKINNISDHLYVSSASQLKKMFDIPFREVNKVLSEITVEPDLLIKEERGYLLKTTLFTSTFTEFFGEQWFFNSYLFFYLTDIYFELFIIF